MRKWGLHKPVRYNRPANEVNSLNLVAVFSLPGVNPAVDPAIVAECGACDEA